MMYTAEDLIAHRLSRSNRILVAKPKFDQQGADLLALRTVRDGAKFCRVQCKGRSLVNSPSQEVAIPRDYATDGFVLFVYVDTGDFDATNLFCFLGREVRNWRDRNGEYVRSFSKTGIDGGEFDSHRFSDAHINEIERAIENVDVSQETAIMSRAYAHLNIGPLQFSGTTIVGPPPAPR